MEEKSKQTISNKIEVIIPLLLTKTIAQGKKWH